MKIPRVLLPQRMHQGRQFYIVHLPQLAKHTDFIKRLQAHRLDYLDFSYNNLSTGNSQEFVEC